MRREGTLAVAVDYPENACGHDPCPGRNYTPDEIGAMIAYFRELGVGRLYWFFGDHHHVEGHPYADGADLLAHACRAAHAADMELFAVIKPFETGVQPHTIPPHLDPPADATRTVQGWHVAASSFAADHPERRLKYRLRAANPPGSGRVRTARLVQGDDRPMALDADDVEILWSDANSQYRRYEGPREATQTLEPRGGLDRRVLSFTELELPADARFILLRFASASGAGELVNTPAEMLELEDEAGRLPSQGDLGRVPVHVQYLLWPGIAYPPATRAVLEDPARRAEAFENHFVFDGDRRKGGPRPFDRPGGFVCHCLDFDTHCSGALHPGYPAVRAYWLGRVEAALDAGVDGVALRIANHSSWSARGQELGFNEPALEAYARRAGGRPDLERVDPALLREVNGDFYTQFLREAAGRVRDRGRSLHHFVHPISEGLLENVVNNVPATFRFDCRRWLAEGLVDGLCMRPMGDVERDPFFGDYLGSLARYFGVEMLYANRNGPLVGCNVEQTVPEDIADELERVRTSPLYDGFILYEAADIMGIDTESVMHTCEPLRAATAGWR